MVGDRGGYRYHYYMCGNARRNGREVCPSPILRKDKVERFVINRIKDCILTDDNLEELLQAKADAEEALRYQAVDMADRQVVRDYVDDLRGLLERSSIIEQRGFLKSFVDKIEVSDSEVNICYTIPMPPSSLAEETAGVIPFVHHG